MFANSKPVTSPQQACHEQLEKTVRRHLDTTWKKPVARHNEQAFRHAQKWLSAQNVSGLILDSGCGSGRSALALARQHPQQAVIGIDQSARRLSVLANAGESMPDNLLLLRAECADFWRLMANAHWPVTCHYLLYPNPWPKPAHLKRRWHGHPVFPVLMGLPGELVLRSNWDLYVDEFVRAAAVAGRRQAVVSTLLPDCPLSDFERKYHESGQRLFQCRLPVEMSTG